MLWVPVLGAILLGLPQNGGALRTQQRGQGNKSYQISPKPCQVNHMKGTCMFVWECIKSEGTHLGMCVDSFMFGSCCAHNQAANAIPDSGSGADSNHNDNVPTILYSPPNRPISSNLDSSIDKNNQRPQRPQRPSTSNLYMDKNGYLRPSTTTTTTTSTTTEPNLHKFSNKPSYTISSHHGLSGSASFITSAMSRPSQHTTKPPPYNLGAASSSPPRGTPSLRPVATDGGSDSWKTRPSSTVSIWQVTTEPSFVTKPRPNKPTITNNIINNYNNINSNNNNNDKPVRPTKKPTTLLSQWTKPTTPVKTTTTKKPINLRPSTTLTLIGANNNGISTSTTAMSTTMPTTTTNRAPVVSTTMSTTAATLSTTQPTSSSFQTFSPTSEALMPTSTLSSVSAATTGDRTARCGVTPLFPRPEKRIVGGKTAPFGRWPWQVSVRRTSFFGFSSTHRCGGAVLNENWIATAGHCVDDLLTSQIRIRVGEYDFSKAEEDFPFVERMVAKKVVHPKYNFYTYEYDLALVRLDKPLEFAPHISPICLPASDDLLIGENATVTGWGRLSEGGTLPSVLQEVQVPIVSNDRCKSMFLRAGRHEFIPEIFLCAGHERGGQDSCQGDSGGPLQVKGKDGRYFLAGIISWGIGCAEANLPGVCTRISKFVPWILENVT